MNGLVDLSFDTLGVARDLNIEIRLLPTATPELNAMNHLWRQVKGRAVSNRPTRSIDVSAIQACQHILQMNSQQRLQSAGVLSGHFWLTS